MTHAIEQHAAGSGLQIGRPRLRDPRRHPGAGLRGGGGDAACRAHDPLLEATMTVAGRPVVRGRAWLLSRQDTPVVAGGAPEPMPGPEDLPAWDGPGTGRAGTSRRSTSTGPPRRPGARGRGSRRCSDAGRRAGRDGSRGSSGCRHRQRHRRPPATRRVDVPQPRPHVHLYRQPVGGPVGLDTTVVFGPDGVGLTSSVLHDADGAVGRAEQILTVRPLGAR